MKSPMPYALSTAWNSRKHKSGKKMAEEIKSLGFNSIELNFSLTSSQVKDFIKLKDLGLISITSTHNYCPLPDGVKQKHASPEYYSLTSLDEEERRLAIKFTKNSMDAAKRLGARVLILHLGRVEMSDKTKRLFTTIDKEVFKKRRAEVLNKREKKKKIFLKNGLKSLKTLLKYAHKIDLGLAIENRYYIKEIPSLDELKIIFKTIKDKHLFYWHDTGHAKIYENLGISKYEDFLKTLSNRLIGVHLHDIILFDDHRAPGSGEFDFKRLKPFLKKNTIKVIEVHRSTSSEDIKKSVRYLERVL